MSSIWYSKRPLGCVGRIERHAVTQTSQRGQRVDARSAANLLGQRARPPRSGARLIAGWLPRRRENDSSGCYSFLLREPTGHSAVACPHVKIFREGFVTRERERDVNHVRKIERNVTRDACHVLKIQRDVNVPSRNLT